MRGGVMVTWRTDPVAFIGHPSFFLAHELAHQWWGQAVGWKNYHEQWLSEGLAQYFAALHVQQQDGDEAFEDILSELRRWSLRHSDLVRAFETEAKRSLEDFFERWIYDFDLPTLRFSYHTEARLSGQQGETDAILRFEQQGIPFEIPVTATLRYRKGAEETVVVPVTGQLTEFRVPLSGRLRDVRVNEDNAALAEIRR